MRVVIVNRKTNVQLVIPDCSSISLVDTDNEPHAPQYLIPNERQQLLAREIIVNRPHQQAARYATCEWSVQRD